MRRLKSLAKDAFWLTLATLIVVGGIAGFQVMGALKEPVDATPVERIVPFVETATLEPYISHLPVRGEGFVKPFKEIDLAAEVSGRVVELHPAIASRGHFDAGEVLLRLDDSAARAALAKAEADIASTQAKLDLNEIQLDRALRLIERSVVSQDNLDELRAENAELQAVLQSLQAERDNAAINLEDTRVQAPFGGAVLDQISDLGAVVGAGEPIARIYTDERLEVTVPVTETEAALIPDLFERGAAAAEVTGRFAGRDITWSAHLTRIERSLDSRTRTLNVTVTFDDVAGGTMREGAAPLVSGPPPALVNAFVNVVIEGAQMEDVFAVPSTSIREGATIWMAENEQLSIHQGEIVHIDGEVTYVRLAEVPEEARLIISPLEVPIEGARVRTRVTAPDLVARAEGE